MAGILIGAPVRGLRPVVALRRLTAKVPKPAMRTSLPFFSDLVIASRVQSRARVASDLVRLADEAIELISSCYSREFTSFVFFTYVVAHATTLDLCGFPRVTTIKRPLKMTVKLVFTRFFPILFLIFAGKLPFFQ